MTGRERETRAEVPLVDVEVGAADAASVHPQEYFVRLDFRNINIAICELSRCVVNDCFHGVIIRCGWFLAFWKEALVSCDNKQNKQVCKILRGGEAFALENESALGS